MSDIGNQIGMAKPHVHRAIAGLEALGLLVVERTSGQRTSSVYSFPEGWDEDGSGEQFLATIKILCRAKKAAKTDAPDAIHSYQSGNSKTAQAEPETDPPNGFHSYRSGNPHSYQSGNAFKQDKRPAPIYAAKRGRNCSKKNDGIKPQNAGGNLRATKAPKGAEE